MPEYKVRNYDRTEGRVPLERDYDYCPLCHNGIVPTFIMGIKHKRQLKSSHPSASELERFEIVYQCPRSNCSKLFIAYGYIEHPGGVDPRSKFTAASPMEFRAPKFGEEIQKLSPQFVRIFEQSAHAEVLKLDSICGPGYRKALEFIIKDYLISKAPDDAKKQEIRKTFLGNLVKAPYITNPNINKCAERAVWLGNDEGHYERRYEEHDIEDLKVLIKLVVHWIESEILTAQFSKDIQKI